MRGRSSRAERLTTANIYSKTQTGAEGNFRLRGLQPGKEYRVRVKIGADQRIDRASPSEGYLLSLPEVISLPTAFRAQRCTLTVTSPFCAALLGNVQNRPLVDEQHKDFLVFRRLPKVDLTGEVNTDPHSLPTLKVLWLAPPLRLLALF